jgi:hypothetical protein
MSKEAVQTVIGKAVTDSKFRQALFASPEKALKGYDLTAEEIAGLKAIDSETMESLAGSLDERISKAFMVGWSVGSGSGRKAPGKAPARRGRVGGPREGP